ncbi:MAG: ELWxxDGT repeat protein, partial [Cyanobacteriota bacterium]
DPTTTKVAQIGTGYYPAELTAAGNRLFFVGDDSHGAELWMSDGTSAGTGLVRDINPSAGAGAPGPRRGPTQLTPVGDDRVYFAANDGSSGYELWRSDGTSAGTVRVLDINTGSASSHPLDLTPYGNLLYFTASDSTNGRQLWVTDTLSNTTSPLSSRGMFGSGTQFFVPLGYGGNDRNLTIAGRTLFFSGYSRDGSSISGYELWGLDLPPMVSMALRSGASADLVSEDGPAVGSVLFRRTGDTSSPLTVTFRVAGSASFGLDYDVREATSFNASAGSITFATGASTAVLLLDPSSDGRVEGNEDVVLSLLSGPDYAVASTAEAVTVLVDNDSASGAMAGAAIPRRLATNTAFEHRNNGAFAALKRDGSVITWGEPFSGGDSSAVASQLSNGVARIFSNSLAFAALKHDGSVVSWGFPTYGGDSSAVASQLASGVVQIASNFTAFAALKSDGSVVPWGDPFFGNFGSSAVSAQLASNVKQLFASRSAFAALKGDGSVVTWGDPSSGGDSAAVRGLLSAGVVEIIPGDTAFAALKRDGSVVTWGDSSRGGSSGAAASQLSSGVVRVFSNSSAFAAVKADGSVVTWGDASFGGDSSAVASQLGGGIKQIAATVRSFAALKTDGSVVTWGGEYGPPSFNISDPSVAYKLSFGVERLYATNQVFAALKTDGSVVAWGHPLIGGDTSAVQAQLSSGVIDIVTNDDAFAALKSDGSVVTWGAAANGADSSAVSAQLRSGVTRIFSTFRAFAALKNDGSVVTWGDPEFGGFSGAVASRLGAGVVGLASPFSDDRAVLPIISLQADISSVSEDGPNNLRFTFRRTGAASDPLTVSFQLSDGLGAATFATDFSQTGASPHPAPQPWTITFAAGSPTATLEIDPVADTLFERDESITLSLVANPAYGIGSAASAMGLIQDDDRFTGSLFTTIEAQGNTKLLRRLDNKPFAQVGSGPRLEITSPWNSSPGSDSTPWQMLAADTIAGVNTLLWRNNDGTFLHLWTLDANWNWASSGSVAGLDSSTAWSWEEQFQVDA